ncbi:octopamine receptor beta-2R-like [Crassostrea angulata]|uniref:octopamine receptor beta-2R-like n=1 Tax=Magallana angulata TaxID=2784310 RepID=UPI0022B09D44|nr:octopamine receptor beta-2R-like [Crassostrea angulata]XP_052706303.1 octopamine receptor beta-2R-like [Crassostrea angulata]XP_052706304.1 octopamine receptor beta-2R-like [Crassostrea angulata]XP_052706305.1 octopamine receptor beta-2R-like [Crassostrea angulata]
MLKVNDMHRSTDLLNNTLSNGSAHDSELEPSVNIFVVVLKAVAMTLIMGAAIVGNSLVIISVKKFEKLRGRVTNYFIVSLAFADIVVAILVMPFNASQEITGKWLFGRAMCDIFNSNDVLFSTASILHLCCISVDRYIAINYPLQYDSKMTKRCACAMILTTWVASVLISYIPIHAQFYTTNEHFKLLEQNPDSCTFQVNRIYAVVSSSVSFWIPCTIMIFVYFRIFITARRQEKHIRTTSFYSYKYIENGNSDSLLPASTKSGKVSERTRWKREHKAAKTLGVVMGAFIMCFLPFFSWYLITSLCADDCPYPPLLGSILFWIGYLNSCLNPIIYAYYNLEFRTAFKRLLHMRNLGGSFPSSSSARNGSDGENNKAKYIVVNKESMLTNV